MWRFFRSFSADALWKCSFSQTHNRPIHIFGLTANRLNVFTSYSMRTHTWFHFQWFSVYLLGYQRDECIFLYQKISCWHISYINWCIMSSQLIFSSLSEQKVVVVVVRRIIIHFLLKSKYWAEAFFIILIPHFFLRLSVSYKTKGIPNNCKTKREHIQKTKKRKNPRFATTAMIENGLGCFFFLCVHLTIKHIHKKKECVVTKKDVI